MKITATDIEDSWLDGYQSAIIVLLEVKKEMPLMAEIIDRLAALLQDVKPVTKGTVQ